MDFFGHFIDLQPQLFDIFPVFCRDERSGKGSAQVLWHVYPVGRREFLPDSPAFQPSRFFPQFSICVTTYQGNFLPLALSLLGTTLIVLPQ